MKQENAGENKVGIRKKIKYFNFIILHSYKQCIYMQP